MCLGNCYKVLINETEWNDARLNCESEGAELSTIRLSQEWDFVKGSILKFCLNYQFDLLLFFTRMCNVSKIYIQLKIFIFDIQNTSHKIIIQLVRFGLVVLMLKKKEVGCGWMELQVTLRYV